MTKPHIVVVANQKGGAGKTTICRLLAATLPAPVGLLDTDPQGTLTGWWNRRAADDHTLYAWDGAASVEAVAATAAADGCRTLIVDTPPSVHDWVADVLRAADLVVIPVQPSVDDIDACAPTLEMVETAGRPFVFLVTQASPRTRIAGQTITRLAADGRVCPTTLHTRMVVREAHNDGRTAVEVAPKSPAAAEARAMAGYLHGLLTGRPRKQAAKKTAKRVGK